MPELSYRAWIARSLARALLADALPCGTHRAALLARGQATLGEAPPWLAALVDALGSLALSRPQLTLEALSERILGSEAFEAAFEDGAVPRVHRLILRPARMRPPPLGLDGCALPALPTAEALAAWLGLDLPRLLWLTNEAQAWRPATQPHRQPARHYRCVLHPKRRGGLRLIEAPKADLKRAQHRLLEGLLDQLPLHEAAHGFVRGRSVATHAALHAGRAVVMRFDLRDFFPGILARRVHALWTTLGYPRGTARLLTTLCTTRTPPDVRARLRDDGGLGWWGAKRLASAHLPQGAPTSPALANLCAFGLDLRLDGLAHAFGATYSRYADDLVFSGPPALRAQARALADWVHAIVADEGFEVNPDKTRCMPAHRQQRVTGLVVNAKAQTPRRDHDLLKAILHRGTQQPGTLPAAQREVLRGRIAWVAQFNAARGERLMRCFERIVWAPAA